MNQTISNELYLDLLNGTAKISWKELELFYAKGKLIHVSVEYDLIDVGIAFVKDQKQNIEQLLETKKLVHVTSSMAKSYQLNNTTLWALVISPWVLIQDINKK